MIGLPETVGYRVVKRRFWHTASGFDYKISWAMKLLLKDYFKNRKEKDAIINSCKEFSKEQYCISDARTIEFFKKMGISPK